MAAIPRLALAVCSLVAVPLSAPIASQGGAPAAAFAVEMTSLAVEVEIVDGVATTRLRHTIRNSGFRPAEATWVLPLPAGAVADGLRMTVGGVEMESDVHGADQARDIYESIVRRRRDPALLEYLGRGCLRARVFPVPPQDEVEVETVFRQVLPKVDGSFHWSFPVAASGLGGRPPLHVTLDLSLCTTQPLQHALSPLGRVDVARVGPREARASLEAPGSELREELALFFGFSEEDLGVHLMSTRPQAEDRGTFVLLLTPTLEDPEDEPVPRTISFVVDTSGSMKGQKLAQVQGALNNFLQSLRPDDRFDIVPFSTVPRPFFGFPVEASAANLEEARERVRILQAQGGTNVHDSLIAGLSTLPADPTRLSVVVFLTDGLPTVGTQDVGQIEAAARRGNDGDARIFVFGVGDDVNTLLLDRLAASSRGERAYVRPGQSIESHASALFTKLSHPALTDVQLEIEGVEVTEQVPAQLPDLFRGSTLTVTGRYRGGGPKALRLRGRVGEAERVFPTQAAFAAGPTAGLEFLPSLWAERWVGVLLDAVRLNGPEAELLAEIQRLGQKYRIVTPYTSHLVVEEGLRARAGGGGARPGPSGAPVTGRRGPSTPGPITGGGRGGGGTYRGPGDSVAPPPDLDDLARQLVELGVLPKDASAEERRDLALKVAQELRASAAGLAGLGREASGKRAVDDSTYLAGLMRSGSRNRSQVLDLFTRRIRGRVFALREGVWTDQAFDHEVHGPRIESIEAWSEAYFALLRARPDLGPYLALSDRIRLVDGERVLDIRPPAGD